VVFGRLKKIINMQKASRRDFLKKAAAGVAAFTIVPRFVLGGKNFLAPSDILYVGCIGIGGKGESDVQGIGNCPNARIAALCDVDDRMTKKSRESFPKAPYYKDFRQMLEKEKGIDAVSVSTPDHTHAVAAIAAITLGKHAYVQKPLTHNIYEARMLADAAKKHKVVTQMGNQFASADFVRVTKEWIDAGLIGDVTRVHAWTNRPVWPQGIPTPTGKFEIPKELDWDLWLGPAKFVDYNPAYLPFNWRGWWPYGTGALGDMGCHILDAPFRILPIDFPTEVECSSTTAWSDFFKEARYTESCPASSIIHMKFPRKDGKGTVKITWMDGGLIPERPEELLPGEVMGDGTNGYIFEGTKGKLAGNYSIMPTLLPTSRMKEVTFPAATLPRVKGQQDGHFQQWVDACHAGYGKATVSSPFEYAGPFTEAVLMGNLAIRSYGIRDSKGYPGRKKLLWDAQNMKITNFDEANAFVKRDYRSPYTL
jgi:hypothetical protein